MIQEINRNGQHPKPRFKLGKVVITLAAQDILTHEEITKTLSRHIAGDWSDVCDDDARQNDHALNNNLRILSVYTSKGGIKFWIITEADRSATTILLPEDY